MSTQIIVEYTRSAKSEDQPLEEQIRQNKASSAADEELLGNRNFFVGKSLAELAREQGVKPIKDISVFAGGFPEDEDLDELLAELDRIRNNS